MKGVNPGNPADIGNGSASCRAGCAGSPAADSLLEVSDLRTHFASDEGVVRAVDGVSFRVAKGDSLGIVGESGCGKTVANLSVLRLIPSPPGKIVSGKALFEGEDLLAMPYAGLRRIRGNSVAMIFQDPMTSLNPFLRIERQMTEVLETHKGMSRRAARAASVAMLDRVGIPAAGERIFAYPHQFSGGMRQRVMIAMALSCNPRLLIADEPTTALDVTIQAQILEIIKEMQRQLGMALILITHDLGVVAGMCRRILVMYAGRVVEEADVASIFGKPLHPYTMGLLGSVPRLDSEVKSRLDTIPGQPPTLAAKPAGCSFAPRCRHVTDRCRTEEPVLRDVGKDRKSACLLDF